jgi:hypothetical protein
VKQTGQLGVKKRAIEVRDEIKRVLDEERERGKMMVDEKRTVQLSARLGHIVHSTRVLGKLPVAIYVSRTYDLKLALRV